MIFSTRTAHWFYRLAVVFCFLAFGIWELVEPTYWVGYVPDYLAGIADPRLLVLVHGVLLTIVGIGVFIGWKLGWFALLGVLLLVDVLITVWLVIGWSDTFIRDVVIFIFALGFLAENWKK